MTVRDFEIKSKVVIFYRTNDCIKIENYVESSIIAERISDFLRTKYWSNLDKIEYYFYHYYMIILIVFFFD